ncbi:MAG: CPBP family intramembrane metalloprotease [Anaerolineae bacterium]|nr:CPBP family intramembrane metalloprotease [Anaerolineae bacterium]
MGTSIALIAIHSVFIVLIQRGKYSAALAPTRRPAREYLEVALVIIGLLIVPFIKFNLFWFSGWISAYLAFLLIAPPIMEWIVRRRSLSAIGFRMPQNKRALAWVAVLLALYLVARLAWPIAQGRGYQFNLQTFVSNSLLFALLEEAMFRGVIQTRLESALGAARSWVVSGLVFGFYHYYVHYLVPGKAAASVDILSVASLTVLGMLLGVVFAKTRSLLPSFLIHALHNLAL